MCVCACVCECVIVCVCVCACVNLRDGSIRALGDDARPKLNLIADTQHALRDAATSNTTLHVQSKHSQGMNRQVLDFVTTVSTKTDCSKCERGTQAPCAQQVISPG